MTDSIFDVAANESTESLPSLEGVCPEELAKAICDILDAKKGRDIKLLHVEKKTVIADYFVLCTGNSSTQVKALADEVEYRTGQRGRTPTNVEGRDNVAWIILDYDSVIVHVFSREAREYYNLDKLYNGASEMNRETAD